jgi:hypothetical protein
MNSFPRRCRMMDTAFCLQIIGLFGEWKTNKRINLLKMKGRLLYLKAQFVR